MAIHHNIQVDFNAPGILEFNGQRYGVKAMSIRHNPDSYPFFEGYLIPEVFAQSNAMRTGRNPQIERVIFNNPATIVVWSDGSKTVVKCQPGDTYSKETGLALCIAKKYLGNKGNFNEVFKKWIPDEDEIPVEKMRFALDEFCARRNCLSCPLDEVSRCGRGTYFFSVNRDGSYNMTDAEIRDAYKIATK